MKVCDKHRDKEAVDSIHIETDDVFIDVCDECKFAVMTMLTSTVEAEPETKRERLSLKKVFSN